jgi:hypothetical protein
MKLACFNQYHYHNFFKMALGRGLNESESQSVREILENLDMARKKLLVRMFLALLLDCQLNEGKEVTLEMIEALVRNINPTMSQRFVNVVGRLSTGGIVEAIQLIQGKLLPVNVGGEQGNREIEMEMLSVASLIDVSRTSDGSN